MSDPVIHIENLYKEYRLGTIGYGTLREDLESFWAKLRGKKDPNSIINKSENNLINSQDHILALNNINLKVNKGERLGIIGKNGAGKTTLLKILSRISSPTSGIVKIKGRVASLIAVGTGFHPELTGRENIYLNGAILGLKKREIKKRFDGIIDFSGVEKFIDTPVKRYSSGMHIRLGFAVAAHLEPDLLIIDEILAVGDADFQKKAIGKIKDINRKDGRTVLFVSHNMKAIANLCNKVIFLEKGKIKDIGTPKQIIQSYLNNNRNKTKYFNEIDISNVPQKGNGSVTIQKIMLIGDDQAKSNFDINENIKIQIDYYNKLEGNKLCVYIQVLNKNEEIVYASGNLRSITTGNDKWFDKPHPKGMYQTFCLIPGNFLNSGEYNISVFIQSNIIEHAALSGPIIKLIITDELGSISELNQEWPGYIRKKIIWKTNRLSN